jgi:hypothetical protein
VWLVEKLS